MKTLQASPSSKVLFEIHRDNNAGGLVKRVEEASCFLRPQRKNGDFRFVNLVAFLQQRKPIICLASKTKTEFETADAEIQEPYQTKTTHVKFKLQKQCSFGQHFLIVGDDPIFGLWDPENAIPMNWSDGNVWSVELDIPAGKAIQFKFILQGSAGSVLWQPGPDRIFQTWETNNTITVFEDWGDAELQKITEEERASNQIDHSIVNSDMLIAEADNLTYPKEELGFNTHVEPTLADDVYIDPAEIPLMEPFDETNVASNGYVPRVDMTPKWPKQMMEPHVDQLITNSTTLDEERLFPSDDFAANSNKMMVADNLVGDNGRAAKVRNLTRSHIEGSLIDYEEGPVLVPGLTPAPTVPTEEANREEAEKPMSFDGSVGDFEIEGLNIPEPMNQLEVEQETYSELTRAETIDKQNPEHLDTEPQNKPPQAEAVVTFNNNEESLENELGQEDDFFAIHDDVLHSDIHWVRQKLQKFLNVFRYL